MTQHSAAAHIHFLLFQRSFQPRRLQVCLQAQCGQQWLKQEPQGLGCLVCDYQVSAVTSLFT